ncbi:hypothetical protein D3C78_1625560 [compost metagenome]
MRGSCISDFVNSFNYGVIGGVKANGVIGTKKVIVDSAWNAHHRNVEFARKYFGAGKASVSSNNN